jgi:hypothetical protein
MRTSKVAFRQLLRNHLGQAARSASPDGSFAIARIAIAKDPAPSNDRFVAATVARSTRYAYFSPSRTAFQADRGRCFRLIADGISV